MAKRKRSGLGRPSSYGKREYELRIEHARIGPRPQHPRITKKYITVTPREAVRAASKAVRDGKGSVARATVHADSITLVACSYSIRPRKPTRRVEKSFARCTIDPIFKRNLR